MPKVQIRRPVNRPPVWDGPESDTPNGGITFSALSRWLSCRERFRVQMIEGWKPNDAWNAKIEFGSMWHVCEEAHAAGKDWGGSGAGGPLGEYARGLIKKYPLNAQEIEHWYLIIRMQFPLYVAYWAQHPDTTDRRPLLQERVFRVKHQLPSGRTVYLRGKWDGVDLLGKGKAAAVYNFETKTKQRIDEGKIKRQLSFDLQTGIYLVALHADRCDPGGNLAAVQEQSTGWLAREGGKGCVPLAGVRYNVIKRSEHRVGKKETREEFIERLRGIIVENPEDWFMRWRVEVSPTDIQRFRRECLDPILEQLCDWYSWIVSAREKPFSPDDGAENSLDRGVNSYCHFRMPFGADNAVSEYGWGDLDSYLESGSTVGLRKVDTLFGELQ